MLQNYIFARIDLDLDLRNNHQGNLTHIVLILGHQKDRFHYKD